MSRLTPASSNRDATASSNRDATASSNRDATASSNRDATASSNRDATASSNRDATASSTEEPVAEVACPHCEQPVVVPVPDRDVDLAVRSYPAAYGDHTVVQCEADHEFWVYYC